MKTATWKESRPMSDVTISVDAKKKLMPHVRVQKETKKR